MANSAPAPSAKEMAKWEAEAAQAQASLRYFVKVDRIWALRGLAFCEVVNLWKEANCGDNRHDGRPE